MISDTTSTTAPDDRTGSADFVLRAIRDELGRNIESGLDSNDPGADIDQEVRLLIALADNLPPTIPERVFEAPGSWGSGAVGRAAHAITPLLVWLAPESGPVAKTSSWILESARTTTLAIGLLIRFGFLTDGEARWRGLYEEACQMALLARAFENQAGGTSDVAASAYLAHGHNNLEIARQVGLDLDVDYDWLRLAGYSWAQASRITQSKVFKRARLSVVPDRETLHHGSVHMSSRAAAEGGTPNGQAPPGASCDRAVVLVRKTLLTLDDLISNVSLALTVEFGSDRPEVARFAYAYHKECADALEGFSAVT